MPRTLFVPLLLTCSLALFGGRAAADAWLDQAWPHRLELTADPSLIDGTEAFADFTLLLSLSGTQHAEVFAAARSDGADLVFTAADGTTILGHEVVSYDAVAEAAELWFKAPTLSDTNNRFYLYFGNPAANTTPVAGAAWTQAHIGVFHFEPDPTLGTLPDSGPSGNHATTGSGAGWTSESRTDGAVGKGWEFNGQDTFVDADAVQSASQTHTISAWFSLSNLLDDANFAFSVGVGFWHLSAKRNGGQLYPDLVTSKGFIRWNPQITDNGLHHYAWTLDAVADTARFFFDGVERNYNLRYVPNWPYQVYTGEVIQGQVALSGPLYEGNPWDLMEGITDEFRIYDGLLSPAWIKTEYNNMAQADVFFQSVVQNAQPTAVDPFQPVLARLRVWPNPFSGRAEIRIEGGESPFEVAVYDLAGRRVRLLDRGITARGGISLIWDGRNDHGIEVSAGTYFVRAESADAVTSAKVLMVR